MTFDKGATTFDLQDTEFYNPYELFDRIKYSHSHPYRLEREYKKAITWFQGQCVEDL